jgi:type IV pilus assembly protein PilQ
MKEMIHGRMPDEKHILVALRAALVFTLALVICGGSARQSCAQTQKSQLHAAFKNPVKQAVASDEPAIGKVVLASAAQKPAAKPAKPAARKLPPPKTQTPPAIEHAAPPPSEALPEMPLKSVLPLAGSTPGEGLTLKEDGSGNISLLIVRDRPLSQVLSLLAQRNGLNIVASNDIDAMISITLRDVPLEEALTAILAVANYTWVRRNNIILITSIEDAANLPADVQGRQIQVFDLDFVSAATVAEAVQNFLSPIGKISVSASNKANNRMTQERVVVEDLPASVERIATYISQVDRPPRQVLIEAHVLQINLDDTTRCGVNLSQLVRVHGANLNIKTTGLANSSAPQAFLATLDGADLGGVIELLETSTDAKTLGSPKLLVLNEQEARLQVGEHLGFKVTTTTETSTLETVQFLDVGVVLRITPRVTRDGTVLLHVKPEVSKGAVSPETGLPESQTAELETDVMLNDGQGMVIGGLIKENDTVTQQKVPYLGNVKGVGFLFRRSEITKERAEIIVALVPRIQPYDCNYQAFEQGEIVKAGVPLMHGPLLRNDRPWDPVLPDGKRIKYPLIPKKHGQHMTGYNQDLGSEYVIPPYPLPEQHFCSDGSESVEPEASRAPDKATGDPFRSDEDLPLPAAGTESTRSTHVISDEPAAPVRKSPGGNR